MKIIKENIRFERGKDPRHTMDIGAVQDAEKIEFFEKDLNKLEHRGAGYVTVQEDDLYLMLIYWHRVREDEKEHTFLFSDRHSGDSIKILDNKWVKYRGKRHFLSTTKEGKKPIRESVSFERGKDPKDQMNIGAGKLIEPFRMTKEKIRGFTKNEIDPVSEMMGLPLDQIYQLGFAGEIDYNKWHHNEWTQFLHDIAMTRHPDKKHSDVRRFNKKSSPGGFDWWRQ